MAKEGQGRAIGLDALADAVGAAAGKAIRASTPVFAGYAPVHLWNPPFCGDLDLRIAADGSWHYLKTPIGRPALVKLFASVLKREGDKYYLVTPVEKCGIRVDDAPFLAVELKVETQRVETRKAETQAAGRVLHLRTNVDDWVACGPQHALRFEAQAEGGLKPYLHVRSGLWAKVTRALYYDLVALGEEREVGGERMFGVASGAAFFPMQPAASVRDFA